MLANSDKTDLDPCPGIWHGKGKDAPIAKAEDLVARSNEELARVDPAEMNLLVAKGLASLADTGRSGQSQPGQERREPFGFFGVQFHRIAISGWTLGERPGEGRK